MRTQETFWLSVLAIGILAVAANEILRADNVAAQPSDSELTELVRQALDGCRVEGEIIRARLLRDRNVIRAEIRCSPPISVPVKLPTR